jgi:hypothetical protein
VRFVPRQVRFGLLQCGLKGARIELRNQTALVYRLTFDKADLLDRSCDLGVCVHDIVGLHRSDTVQYNGDIANLNLCHRDGNRGRGRFRLRRGCRGEIMRNCQGADAGGKTQSDEDNALLHEFGLLCRSGENGRGKGRRVAFKLNQCGQRLAAGGDRHVDRIGQAAKIDAARLKLGNGLHQMNERPAEPVQFPHDQRITRLEHGQRFAEAGPFGMGVADAFVDEYAFAACGLERMRCKASVLSMIETRA